jgi:hypothetical protein
MTAEVFFMHRKKSKMVHKLFSCIRKKLDDSKKNYPITKIIF